MVYAGDCATGINAWLGYQTSEGTIRLVYWNEGLDSWTPGIIITGITPDSSFVGHITITESNTAWRIFTVNTDSVVEQYNCVNCCDNVSWKQGEQLLPSPRMGGTSSATCLDLQATRH